METFRSNFFHTLNYKFEIDWKFDIRFLNLPKRKDKQISIEVRIQIC